jgi:hypothetical protein
MNCTLTAATALPTANTPVNIGTEGARTPRHRDAASPEGFRSLSQSLILYFRPWQVTSMSCQKGKPIRKAKPGDFRCKECGFVSASKKKLCEPKKVKK